MSKFIDTLKIIEEGLLKPMSSDDMIRVDAEAVKERVDEILSISTKNADGSIDVDGDVCLCYLNLRELPLKFNKVRGDFWCYGNKLTSLEGSPKEVGLDFDCSNNKLTSLNGAPKEVGKDFLCFDNKVEFTEYQVREVCDVKGKIYV